MIRIREAGPDDLSALMPLWHESLDVQGAFRPVRVTRDPDEHFAAEFAVGLSEPGHAWLVVEENGAVVAMASLHPERASRMSDEQVLEISRVVVAATHRGRGIGRIIVEHAEHVARQRGMRFLSARIFSRNEGAVAFWDTLGFEPYVETKLRSVPSN